MNLIYLVLSLFLIQVVGAFKPHFLDENHDSDLRVVARKVCWSWSGARNQITRYSTIEKLVQYFESLPGEHELSSCAKNHLKSLRALFEVTSTGNDDICGEQKLALIEKFHHEHFGETYKSHLIELPKVLRAFFFQYVSSISNTCATISHSYFKRKTDAAGSIQVPELDGVLEQGIRHLTGEQNIDSYEDLFLSWSLMDRFSKKVHTEMSDYMIGQFKRIYVRIPETNNLKEFQRICSQSIKPVYSQTILPALRLIDLGYYPGETDFLHQLQTNKFVNRLYKLTVLCETILPVGLIPSNPNDNQTYLVRPADVEISDLAPEPEVTTTPRIIEPVSMGNLIKFGSPNDAFKRCRRISVDIKEREKTIAYIVKLLVKGMKKKKYSNVKLWETKQSIEPMVNEVVERVEREEESPSRRKRSIGSFFRQSVVVLQNVLFLLLLCIFSLINIVLALVVFISSLVVGLMDLVRVASAKIESITLVAVARNWGVDRRK